MTARARVCPSRKNMHSVMNNSGFGILTIIANGTTILIPDEWLCNDGRIKKCAVDQINMLILKANLKSKEIEQPTTIAVKEIV